MKGMPYLGSPERVKLAERPISLWLIVDSGWTMCLLPTSRFLFPFHSPDVSNRSSEVNFRPKRLARYSLVTLPR